MHVDAITGNRGGPGINVDKLQKGFVQPLWKRWLEAHLPTKDHSSVLSSPAVWEDKIYIPTYNGNFYTIDFKTGKQLHDFEASGAVSGSPSISTKDATVYFGTEDGTFYANDAKTPYKNKWIFKAGGGILSSPSRRCSVFRQR